MSKLSLVIKNVDAQATEEQIREYFSQFGQVHGVKMLSEAMICFVSFKDREGARTAKEACG
jgi:RNA recognition motif-containing protein